MNAVLAALKALDSVKIAEDDLETQGINTGRDWEHEGRYVSDQSLERDDPRSRPLGQRHRRRDGSRRRLGRRALVLARRADRRLPRRAARARSPTRARRPMPPRRRWASRSSARARSSRTRAAAVPIMYAADAAAKSAESAPPVKIGPVNVSAQVTVTYIYEP